MNGIAYKLKFQSIRIVAFENCPFLDVVYISLPFETDAEYGQLNNSDQLPKMVWIVCFR